MRFTEEREKTLTGLLDKKLAPLDSAAGEWEGQWRDISRYVRPEGDPQPTASQQDIFDSTAIQALEAFASGVHSQLTSSSERWFDLNVAGRKDTDLSTELKVWLEETADLLYHAFSLPSAMFDASLSEVYQELGSYGTGVLFQEEDAETGFRFRCFPLRSVRCAENSKGYVDTVFRRYRMQARQISQEWVAAAAHPRLAKLNETDEREVIHGVFPVTDREGPEFADAVFHAKGFRFVSVYWIPADKVILSVDGFRTMPYHVPRWSKLAGKAYGRSPAMKALPDIKMVNAMSREMILSAELANKPPLLVDDESLLIPIRQVVPGSVLYAQPGSRLPTPLMSGMQPQLADKELEQRRRMIDAAFYTDLFIRGKKKERQSVLEIQDDRAEITRQLIPMFGRIQSELLTPIIVRSLDILVRQGRCKPPPASDSISKFNPLDVVYTNAATKTQLHGKAAAIGQLFADLAPMAQVDPSVIEVIDWVEAASELAAARDVPVRLVRDKEAVAADKANREAAAQQQMTAQNAQQMTGAIKNVAQARAVDPSLLR